MNEPAKQSTQYCESCSSNTLEECPICMENYEIGVVNKTRTNCGHTLCFKCFIIVNYNSNKCPICRQQMQEQIQEPSIIHYHNHAPRHHTNCIRRIYNYLKSWFSVIDHNTSQINRPHYPPPINRPHYPYFPHPNRRIVPL